MIRSLNASLTDLSANENPVGPSPKALAAITSAMGGLHRYPERGCAQLKLALAERLGVDGRQIAVGNGSCEVLELAVRSLVGPGESVIMGTPGFPAYQGVVQRAGGRAVLVPAVHYQDDLDAMLDRIDVSTRLVLLGNPGNPCGTAIGYRRLLRFLDRLPPGLPVILDEAYLDYVETPDFPDAVDLLRVGRPVIALRSFSKAHGLAGLRVGYAVAEPDLIARMEAGHQQFNINRLAQAAALAALDDTGHIQSAIELNRAGRAELFDGLVARGFDPVPSQTNFLLVPVGDGAMLVRRLIERGVLIKDLGRYGLNDHVRVSTGTAEAHRRFFVAWDAVWDKLNGAPDGIPPTARRAAATQRHASIG